MSCSELLGGYREQTVQGLTFALQCAPDSVDINE